MRAWMNHFALNIGGALRSLWFAIIPPQWTKHSYADIVWLREIGFFEALLIGLVDKDDDI